MYAASVLRMRVGRHVERGVPCRRLIIKLPGSARCLHYLKMYIVTTFGLPDNKRGVRGNTKVVSVPYCKEHYLCTGEQVSRQSDSSLTTRRHRTSSATTIAAPSLLGALSRLEVVTAEWRLNT